MKYITVIVPDDDDDAGYVADTVTHSRIFLFRHSDEWVSLIGEAESGERTIYTFTELEWQKVQSATPLDLRTIE